MRIGVMQGRLLPPENGRFQSHPSRWQEEFALASSANVDYIEWIVDDCASVISIDQLRTLKEKHGIETPAICGDWFMQHPPWREFRAWNVMLRAATQFAKLINATRIIIPLVDNSSMNTIRDMELVVKALEVTPKEIELHLETDLPPTLMAEMLSMLPCHVKANWDSGNSSGLGYVASEEFAAYGDRIGSIHIKDRTLEKKTMPLGQGDADFEDVFKAIRSVNYTGDLTLQVARGEDGDEVNWVRRQAEFVRRFL